MGIGSGLLSFFVKITANLESLHGWYRCFNLHEGVRRCHWLRRCHCLHRFQGELASMGPLESDGSSVSF